MNKVKTFLLVWLLLCSSFIEQKVILNHILHIMKKNQGLLLIIFTLLSFQSNAQKLTTCILNQLEKSEKAMFFFNLTLDHMNVPRIMPVLNLRVLLKLPQL